MEFRNSSKLTDPQANEVSTRFGPKTLIIVDILWKRETSKQKI